MRVRQRKRSNACKSWKRQIWNSWIAHFGKFRIGVMLFWMRLTTSIGQVVGTRVIGKLDKWNGSGKATLHLESLTKGNSHGAAKRTIESYIPRRYCRINASQTLKDANEIARTLPQGTVMANMASREGTQDMVDRRDNKKPRDMTRRVSDVADVDS